MFEGIIEHRIQKETLIGTFIKAFRESMSIRKANFNRAMLSLTGPDGRSCHHETSHDIEFALTKPHTGRCDGSHQGRSHGLDAQRRYYADLVRMRHSAPAAPFDEQRKGEDE